MQGRHFAVDAVCRRARNPRLLPWLGRAHHAREKSQQIWSGHRAGLELYRSRDVPAPHTCRVAALFARTTKWISTQGSRGSPAFGSCCGLSPKGVRLPLPFESNGSALDAYLKAQGIHLVAVHDDCGRDIATRSPVCGSVEFLVVHL